ncbi:protein-S-isoprenylcysteine O-methyltransferase Ste14 [Actinokineospora baliensis]|uniref:hypothetical protein n=1 Tax=Actinokineospora baliensis TaxID=547056 RepID=UPI00195B65E6|nr:hypothetical protein [Actinokineospora baliensis]MBM7770475.1 protein-S-isoprenylcysteine O-methyltransferase Ste14 [Actinokineospora baliensis]
MTTSGPDPNQPYQPMPAAPPINEQLPAAVRPKSVTTSFQLWVVSAILGVIGFIVTVAIGTDALRENAATALRSQGKAATASEIDTVVTAGLVFAGVIAALSFGLYLLFAFKMRAGRNWARMTLAVLGTIGLIVNVLGLVSEGNSPANLVVGVIQVLLVGTAIYFMFTADSKAYFETTRTR